MSTRTAGRLAWGLAATSALLFAAGLALYAAGTGAPTGRVLTFLIVLGFSGVGALVASRQPRNAIGWIFCGAALLGGALGTFGDAYAWYWLDGHGASEGLAKAGASYATVNWIPGVLVPIAFLLLLFPDGRLLTPRWRPVAWCAAVGIAGMLVEHPVRRARDPEPAGAVLGLDRVAQHRQHVAVHRPRALGLARTR